MSAERWSVMLGCPTCGDTHCEPVTPQPQNDRPRAHTPNMHIQRVVRCTECTAEYLLTVELAPLRMTKTNAKQITAPKPRTAPQGRSIYEIQA